MDYRKQTSVVYYLTLNKKEAAYLHALTQNATVEDETEEDKEIRCSLFNATV